MHNIQHDPHVRVRLRTGLRYRWVPGIATVCPGEDPLARQRKIIAWHPLRALNAINVRVFGADLLTVHVKLNLAQAEDSGGLAQNLADRYEAEDSGGAARTVAAQPETRTAVPAGARR